MAKLTRSGLPRRKPGPKPRTIALQAADAASNALDACIQAHDAQADPRAAATAFRKAMPALHTVSIAGWAELVASGMARRVFSGKEASTLLHAAHVAHAGTK